MSRPVSPRPEAQSLRGPAPLRTQPGIGFDLGLLFHRAARAPQIEQATRLRRALRALNHKVRGPTRMQDRVELQVAGLRVALGEVTDIDAMQISRPEQMGRPLQSGRLSYLLAHHDLALRLRIDSRAPENLRRDITAAALTVLAPRAVILRGPGLLLARAEFERCDITDLRALTPGAPLQPSGARDPRPERSPSPFTVTPRLPRKRLFSGSAVIPCKADAELQTQLAAGFRSQPIWSDVLDSPSGTRRLGILTRSTQDPASEDHLTLCPTLSVRFKGRIRHRIAPLMLATMAWAAHPTDPAAAAPVQITACAAP